MSPITAVAHHLRENAQSLSSKIVDDIVQSFQVHLPDYEVEQAKLVYTEFLGFLGDSIVSNEDNGHHKELIEWSKKNGEFQASQHLPISSILERYPSTRSIFTDYLTEIAEDYNLPLKGLAGLIKQFNYLLDLSLNETVYAFERSAESIIRESRKRINELSAPIVAVQEGIAILPLIGLIDVDRVEHLLRNVVPQVAQLQVESLILDFSGILIIDREIARHLMSIHQVLQLLGVSVIATGIRPAIAQAVVQEGVDFSAWSSFATVRQALEKINN